MEQETGCVYPMLALHKGSIEQYIKTVELENVSGVYLDYIFATSYLNEECIYLVFDLDLNPSAIRVKNVDGKTTESWTINDVNLDRLKEFATEREIDVENASIEDIVKNVLIVINKRTTVGVPAYRYQSI